MIAPPSKSGMGHEGRYLPSRLSACLAIRYETFAATRGDGRVAPKTALAVEPSHVAEYRPPSRSGHDSLASLGYDGTAFPTRKFERRENADTEQEQYVVRRPVLRPPEQVRRRSNEPAENSFKLKW